MLYYIYGVTWATFTNIKKCRQNKMNTQETINLLLHCVHLQYFQDNSNYKL